VNPNPEQIRNAEELASGAQVAAAIEACSEALRHDETDPRAHALLGDLLLREDFFDEAITSAMRAIELDAECVPAYLTLGLAYDRRGAMWDRSILVWHELAEVAPDLVTAHVQLGEALSAAAFDDEAIEAWRAALTLDAREARAMYNLAVAALRKEGMATALPGFRKAGELDASEDRFFFELAGADEASGSAPDPAAVASDRESRLQAALALARAQDYFAAADLIRLVLTETPDDSEVLALAAYLYLKQEATNEAMAVALRALALSTRAPAAVYVLGAAFSKSPALNENAARVFGALARAVPHRPMAHVLLAESLLGLQRFADAKRSYLRAIEIDPALVRARFGLAAALLTQGEHSLAAHHIRRAAYHDTRSRGLFARLYAQYAEGRE
jgi:tetratricopeptide (TPR) repeat protein